MELLKDPSTRELRKCKRQASEGQGKMIVPNDQVGPNFAVASGPDQRKSLRDATEGAFDNLHKVCPAEAAITYGFRY